MLLCMSASLVRVAEWAAVRADNTAMAKGPATESKPSTGPKRSRPVVSMARHMGFKG